MINDVVFGREDVEKSVMELQKDLLTHICQSFNNNNKRIYMKMYSKGQMKRSKNL